MPITHKIILLYCDIYKLGSSGNLEINNKI